jgi:GNAT superfamily N-acetyltransferase
MPSDQLTIRVMNGRDIALAGDWAAAEGWNPGLQDAACFAAVDPDGFHIGELGGAAASTISVVNYDHRFAFLGFYIVRPDLRGRGHGLRTWQAAIAHAGSRTIGLDGVVTQQDNYRKSGFVLAHRNIRFGGVPAVPPVRQGLVDLRDIPFAAIEADDATVFPAPRPSFLRAWIGAPGHLGRALVRDGRLAAWGVIRPCRSGHKIGPLVADDRAGAEAVLAGLVAGAGAGGGVFLDVVEPNSEAVALAKACGLTPAFETARMYTGPIRPVALSRIFGITTFELG